MEDSTIVLIISFSIIGMITAFCIWLVVRDRRRFKKLHPQLVERWDELANALGLIWVVPIDHVAKTRSPPALTGTLEKRDVYVALQDESGDEALLQKWVVVVHVGLAKSPKSRKVKRAVLRVLRQGRHAVATIKKRELAVHRQGLQSTPAEIEALVQQCLTAANQLDSSH